MNKKKCQVCSEDIEIAKGIECPLCEVDFMCNSCNYYHPHNSEGYKYGDSEDPGAYAT